jgi:ATPase subunit of ABC transporter with duplicated ATPase domains
MLLRVCRARAGGVLRLRPFSGSGGSGGGGGGGGGGSSGGGGGGGGGVVASFKDVSFSYGVHEILGGVSFSVRGGSKVTIMGQNGSGKSSVIKLLAGELRPGGGSVHVLPGETVALARQAVPPVCRRMTVREYMAAHFDGGSPEHAAGTASSSSAAAAAAAAAAVSNHPGGKLDARIAAALAEVQVLAPLDREMGSFSGGQQARLLLAGALVTRPSVLLLDEPTNNLDATGVARLQRWIAGTAQTVLVISHDEGFLNSFTDAVLYLDVHSRSIEAHAGDYFFVKAEVERRIARENSNNARLAAAAKKKEAQAGKFAGKGGGMRLAAKRMRSAAAEMAGQLVEVRREDEALRPFEIPFTQPPADSGFNGTLLTMTQLASRCPQSGLEAGAGAMVAAPLKGGRPIEMGRGSRLRLVGPNGIGKSTFLELVAAGAAPGMTLAHGASVGFYRQDFHAFDFDASVLETLELAHASGGGGGGCGGAADAGARQLLRDTAARFMLRGDTALQPVGTLSEGQKALLSLACLVLQRPSILILDEPTNHINFRHLPALAAALRGFQGALLLVSHDARFAADMGIAKELDLGYELALGQSSTGSSDGGGKKQGGTAGGKTTKNTKKQTPQKEVEDERAHSSLAAMKRRNEREARAWEQEERPVPPAVARTLRGGWSAAEIVAARAGKRQNKWKKEAPWSFGEMTARLAAERRALADDPDEPAGGKFLTPSQKRARKRALAALDAEAAGGRAVDQQHDGAQDQGMDAKAKLRAVQQQAKAKLRAVQEEKKKKKKKKKK